MTTSARVFGRDGAGHVLEVGQPAAGRVGAVVDRVGANLREHRRVQGIGGRGHEHVLAFVDDGGERQLDAFGRARRDQHAVGRHRHASRREVGGRGLAGAGDAGRRGVAVVAVAHRPGHGLDQVRRGQEPEGVGVADVQVAHRPAGGLHLLRFGHHLPDGIGEAAHARGRADGGHRGGRHDRPILAVQATRRFRSSRDRRLDRAARRSRPSRRPVRGHGPVRYRCRRCGSVQNCWAGPGRLYSVGVRLTPSWADFRGVLGPMNMDKFNVFNIYDAMARGLLLGGACSRWSHPS